MRKHIIILTMTLLAAGMVSCESLKLGDGGLSKAPESSGASIDTLFATIKDSDKVLASAYYYLPYGVLSSFDSKLGGDILESITDHYISNKHSDNNGPNDLYYNGGLGPYISGGNEAYRFGSEYDYKVIRYALFYIENANRIPVTTDEERSQVARKVAEAKVCMAIAYANMVRYVGGVPIMEKTIDLEKDELKFPRATFAETIEYIVRLCDEAAPDLPWIVGRSDDGRMTAAAAVGLKLRMLCFAASPTFNSNDPWHPEAADWENMGKYVRYGQTYDPTLWTRAKDAADEFFANNAGAYDLIKVGDVDYGNANPYRIAYRSGYFLREVKEAKNKEVIISIRKSNSTSYHSAQHDLQADYGCGPSLNWVNKFPYKDGKPFPEDFDWEDIDSWENTTRAPFFRSDAQGTLVVNSEHFAETRDPRLYENIAVPGDLWYDGKVGRAYDNHQYHQEGCPGFLMMKYILQNYKTDLQVPPHWCMMRYAEVLLNAAEAYNECGDQDTAVEFIRTVRNRVGVPLLLDLEDPAITDKKKTVREAIILERELEFGFEEVRWFDMVRWGLTEAFTTKLQALSSKGNARQSATRFTYKVKDAYPPRVWYTQWDTKWYLAPIPAVEVNKGYGMTQNPGWK